MQPSQDMNQHQVKEDNGNHNHCHNNGEPDRPSTPPRPPYSPVTPVFTQMAPVPGSSTSIAPPGLSSSNPALGSYSSPSPTTPASARPSHPPPPPPLHQPSSSSFSIPKSVDPVPISESENPDAIALRSTLSILQMQKQQSIRDIRTLDRMKVTAAADSEGFIRELTAGNLVRKESGGFVEFSSDDDVNEDNTEGQESGEDGGASASRSASRFGKIPNPQNVVRMPPVNWAKYHIVGEPLDKMHEEQLRRPASGVPVSRREDPAQLRAPEHVLASPYRPLVDTLESPASAKVRGTNRNRKA